MKKINAFVLLLILFSLFACNKSNEVVIPQSQPEITASQQESVPEFNESNTPKVSWDQLPENLKNAPAIESLEAGSSRVVTDQKSASRYYRTVGPWGGNGGTAFDIKPNAGFNRIYAIAIQSDDIVHRLVVWYINGSGEIYRGGDKGGNSGTYYVQYFSTDRTEYIIKITGRTGWYVDYLKFYTNKKTFSFGGSGGSSFIASIPSGYQILGFYGRAASNLDKIGFHIYDK